MDKPTLKITRSLALGGVFRSVFGGGFFFGESRRQCDGVDFGVERTSLVIEVGFELFGDDAHAIEAHRERIDEDFGAGAIEPLHREMEVRPGRAAGLTDVPDELTRLDVLARAPSDQTARGGSTR